MAAALVTLLLLSWAGLAAVAVFGYAGTFDLLEPGRHVRLAIPAFLIGTLAHAMTLFYFIGTGRVIREAVQEASLDPAWAAEARSFKAITFPWLLWSLVLIVVVPILGGAVDTGWLPAMVHGGAGVLLLVVSGGAVLREVSCISRNLDLMDRIEHALQGQVPPASAAPEKAPS